MKLVQACEVDVSPIHDVEGSRFGKKLVEDIDVVQFPVGDVDELGNAAPHVHQVMQNCAQGKSARHKSMVVESRA